MKKLLDRAWAKVMAFVLLCLIIPALIGSALGSVFAYCYSGDTFFSEGGVGWSMCCDEVQWLKDYLLECLRENGLTDENGILFPNAWDPENIEAALETYQLDPAISIRLLDGEGNELWDSGTEGNEPVVTSKQIFRFVDDDAFPTWQTGSQSASDSAWSRGSGPVSMTDLSGDPEEEEDPEENLILRTLVAEVYIRLPISSGSRMYGAYSLLNWLINSRTPLTVLACACLALTVLLFIFLMFSAGHKEGHEGIYLGGLNKLPLDLYAGLLVLASFLIFEGVNEFYLYRFYYHIIPALCLFALGAVGLTILVLALCMTLSARFKYGGWWRNTIVFRLPMWLKRVCKKLWGTVWGAVRSVLVSIPLAWRTTLIATAVLLLNILFTIGLFFSDVQFFFFLLLAALDFVTLAALILTSAYFKRLSKAAHAIAQGDLSAVVDTSKMRLDLKQHGEDLNNISLGVSRAVEERMKSERLKTELITNVSHDLKTPLTSIVSYVDLLKKEEIENEKAKEYIEVLDRQSAKLKKLTEDLIDASKASSGAMRVSRERLELGELVVQCRGEYTEKLRKAGVELICSAPERETLIIADGRLLSRVLDNLLQNVSKYSLPGTRAYLNLELQDGKAVLSVKNISRDPLNIPAEELMERFVRGDASRSSEGSGLGLSIAKSLTELMGGTLELVLDGDLFKAVISFDIV